jgi:hypothetical protein
MNNILGGKRRRVYFDTFAACCFMLKFADISPPQVWWKRRDMESISRERS